MKNRNNNIDNQLEIPQNADEKVAQTRETIYIVSSCVCVYVCVFSVISHRGIIEKNNTMTSVTKDILIE